MKRSDLVKLRQRQNVTDSREHSDHVRGSCTAIENSKLTKSHAGSNRRQPLLPRAIAQPKANTSAGT